MSRLNEPAPKRQSWLQAARQQSQALAELRAAHSVPFRWGPRSARWPVRRPLLITAVLAVGVLGLATVTLAMLHSRRAVRPRPTRSFEPTRVAAERVVVARPPAATPRPAPAAVEQPQRPASPRRQVRPARRPATEKTAAAPAQTAAAPAQTSPDKVVFDGEEPGSTIIVEPPRKLGPLWTPDEYKKKRAGQLKY